MEDPYLSNPHDKFFKESFSRKEIARSFIKEYLPEPIQKQLNFKTLAIMKDSFIDKDLIENFTDILYRINISRKPVIFIFCLNTKVTSIPGPVSNC
jgi:predicted transposase/invertase (TIGR01784 family)